MRQLPSHALRFLALTAAFVSSPAMAYVGPGPGLTMIGSLIGLIGSVVVALLMVVIWPLRLYIKKKKAAKAAPPAAGGAQAIAKEEKSEAAGEPGNDPTIPSA